MSARDFLTTEPKGRAFVRALIARHAGVHTHDDALSFAASRWGAGAAQAVAKSVQAITADDVVSDVAAAEFTSLVMEASALGRMAGLRRVPFNTRMLSVAEGATGYWVSEAAPKPASAIELNGSALPSRKVSGTVVATKESIEAQDRFAEEVVQRDLVRAVAATLDQALLDAANSGVVGQVPQAITNGVPTVSATGNLAADLAALVSTFQGDMASAYFICSPTVATRIALAADSGGRYLFPNIGPRGGSLLGVPVITTRHSLGDSGGGTLAMVDPTGVTAAWDAVAMDVATHASLEMTATPDDPGTAETVQVSLFQRNLVGFRAEVRANWRVERAGAVAVLAGV